MILIDLEGGHLSLHAQLTSSRVLVLGYRFFLTVENRQESPNIPVGQLSGNSRQKQLDRKSTLFLTDDRQETIPDVFLTV